MSCAWIYLHGNRYYIAFIACEYVVKEMEVMHSMESHHFGSIQSTCPDIYKYSIFIHVSIEFDKQLKSFFYKKKVQNNWDYFFWQKKCKVLKNAIKINFFKSVNSIPHIWAIIQQSKLHQMAQISRIFVHVAALHWIDNNKCAWECLFFFSFYLQCWWNEYKWAVWYLLRILLRICGMFVNKQMLTFFEWIAFFVSTERYVERWKQR